MLAVTASLLSPVALVLVSADSDASFAMYVPDFVVGFHEAADVPAAGILHGARVEDANSAARFAVVSPVNARAFLGLAAYDDRIRYVAVDEADAVTVVGAPDDPRYGEQYALERIRAVEAWSVTRGSTDVKLAILDSGVDVNHPDLGRFLTGADFTGGRSLRDGCNHGTHVTGTAAATLDNGRGVAGVAQVSIIPVKVVGNRCTGSFSDIANGITWAADHDADIISMSLGCRGCFSQAVADAVDYAVKKGALVVAASGNHGPCSDCVYFPATLPNVMAVACTDAKDATCSFSSSGPEVEIAAPGDAILSTTAGGGYGELSGTSMSAPHVAAVAALVMSHEPALSAGQVRERLRATAEDLGAPGRDRHTGFGRLDAAAALGAGSGNRAPHASFEASEDRLVVRVDASASSDPDGSIASWSWDWGDGSAKGSGETAEHAYGTGGEYVVTLTVKDDAGATASASRRVTVSEGGVALSEDFDDGRADGWTLTGLWRVGGDCGGGASAPNALHHNREGSCTYATGSRETGSATFRVDLASRESPTLSFAHRYEVESYSWGSYDVLRVEASTDGGASWSTLLTRDSRDAAEPSWTRVSLDLSAHRSADTLVRFRFDSVDHHYNGYSGWSVDDVRVE